MIKDTTPIYWGKPCRNGHVNEKQQTRRFVVGNRCVVCVEIARNAQPPLTAEAKARYNAARKQWRDENPQEHAENLQKWRNENREHYRKYQREYRRSWIARNPKKTKDIYDRWIAKKAQEQQKGEEQ
ncbi:hypothetical protein QTI05_24025 [Variovorax sp. J22R193]|uniref:hypothetical protein n=1 Tax=Variovorax fucosicus TaxID=3053517 RepID=UPI002575B768|nr:hypothetical protein [Variovorax sp. J22R193]MDM0042127.1 hypothetical protein [Variovorax sp. J22R193]